MRASPPASPEIEAQLGADPAGSGFWQKFLEALRELNYVEGRNLTVRRAFANGRVDRLPRLVADPVQAKVDVIVTTSTGKWRKNEAKESLNKAPAFARVVL
jgi:putative tryptophan/tyrosine transport system substrate-binding protein